MKTIGIVLVILGTLALIYGGFQYTQNRTVLEMGSMSVTASEQKNFPITAVVGVIVLIGGVALFMTGKRRTQAA